MTHGLLALGDWIQDHTRRHGSDRCVLATGLGRFGGAVRITFGNCPTGPREIIQNGVDGLLVPPNNVSALAVSVKRLMLNDDQRRRSPRGRSD